MHHLWHYKPFLQCGNSRVVIQESTELGVELCFPLTGESAAVNKTAEGIKSRLCADDLQLLS